MCLFSTNHSSVLIRANLERVPPTPHPTTPLPPLGVPAQQRTSPRERARPQRAGQQGVHGQAVGPAQRLRQAEPGGHSQGRRQREEVAGPRDPGPEARGAQQRHVSPPEPSIPAAAAGGAQKR